MAQGKGGRGQGADGASEGRRGLAKWWADTSQTLGRALREVHRLTTRRKAREAMADGLQDPESLPPRRKHALLLLAMGAAVLVWGVGSAILHVLDHPWTRPWDLAWWLGFVGFATTVALPIPFEPALFAANATSGIVVAVLASAAGKTLGAGVVYFLGGALRKQLDKWKAGHPWVAKFLDLTEKLAKKGTYVALGAMMAIPLFPDTLPVYLFSLLGLRLGPFLVASFVGVAVRAAAVLLLGQAVLP
jgi:uncharacterized membrane protein YdjX (TVP38/TMEM64 family)